MPSSSPPCLSLGQAVAAVLQGRLVIFPTETCYGIGCDALNSEAVSRVFQAKRRSHALPLPIVTGSMEDACRLAVEVPASARRLMELFWPGPLSIVLQARSDVPPLLTADTGRVALRYSPHPAVRALCRATGRALVASSANISGRPAPALRRDLDLELLSSVDGVFLAGPEPSGGAPSTIVRVHPDPKVRVVHILRSGAVSEDNLLHSGFSICRQKQ